MRGPQSRRHRGAVRRRGGGVARGARRSGRACPRAAQAADPRAAGPRVELQAQMRAHRTAAAAVEAAAADARRAAQRQARLAAAAAAAADRGAPPAPPSSNLLRVGQPHVPAAPPAKAPRRWERPPPSSLGAAGPRVAWGGAGAVVVEQASHGWGAASAGVARPGPIMTVPAEFEQLAGSCLPAWPPWFSQRSSPHGYMILLPFPERSNSSRGGSGGSEGSEGVGETGKFDFLTSGRRGRSLLQRSGRRGWGRFLEVGEAGTGSNDDGRGRGPSE